LHKLDTEELDKLMGGKGITANEAEFDLEEMHKNQIKLER